MKHIQVVCVCFQMDSVRKVKKCFVVIFAMFPSMVLGSSSLWSVRLGGLAAWSLSVSFVVFLDEYPSDHPKSL